MHNDDNRFRAEKLLNRRKGDLIAVVALAVERFLLAGGRGHDEVELVVTVSNGGSGVGSAALTLIDLESYSDA